MLSWKMMTLWRRRLMTSHIKMRSAYWQQRPACYRISEDYLNALLHSNLTLGVLWAKTHRAGGYSSCVRCQASRLLQLTARSSRVSVIPRRSHLARCNYERSNNCTFIISASTAAEGLTGGWGGRDTSRCLCRLIVDCWRKLTAMWRLQWRIVWRLTTLCSAAVSINCRLLRQLAEACILHNPHSGILLVAPLLDCGTTNDCSTKCLANFNFTPKSSLFGYNLSLCKKYFYAFSHLCIVLLFSILTLKWS